LKGRGKRLWNKYTRLAVILGLALIVAVTTAKINQTYIDDKVKLVKIVVAAEHIKPYTELTRENLTYREVVKAEVPGDAIESLGSFLAEGPVYAGEVGFVKGYPVKKSLTNKGIDSAFGAALTLKEGKSYLGIAIDQVRAQFVKPGTVVDAYCFFESAGFEGGASVISKIEEPLLGNLYVHAVRGKDNQDITAESTDLLPVVAVVETTSPEQTARLIYYQMLGKIFLVPNGAAPEKFLQSNAF
jgi:Flp pilus assembly protein CpaB